MSSVLILGANGFLGKAITAAMAGRAGTRLVGFGLGSPPPGVDLEWSEVDLLALTGAELADRIGSVDPAVIVNAAGATGGAIGDLVRANVLVSGVLLEALGALPDATARLVHLGSAAEYGPGSAGTATREDAVPAPEAPYGITKLAASQLVLSTAAARSLDVVVLRVFNPLGPGMPTSSLPGAAVARLRDALRLHLGEVEFGPLGSVRDFVDVRDVADAVVAASFAPGPLPGILNIGSGIPRTARDIVTAVSARLGFDGRIAETQPGSIRSGGVSWQVADVSLARRELGWMPARELDASIELVVADGGR